jgi:hypothetical protein
MGFIKITLENPEELDDIRQSGGVQGSAYVNMEVEQLYQDEAIGLLLDAYTKVAQDLINSHPKDCHNCAAFEFHSRMLVAAQQLENELVKKYFNVKKPIWDTKTKKRNIIPPRGDMWEK